jgi:8-oxo-dGTP diphosphatase
VAVGERVRPDVPVADGRLVLRVWTVRITAGEPAATEHLALRWLRASELDTVPWLPADRTVLPFVRHVLTAPAR